jgi:hypothetical protein
MPENRDIERRKSDNHGLANVEEPDLDGRGLWRAVKEGRTAKFCLVLAKS